MPANYVLLGKVNLAASAASVTFSNIPQTGYTDLKVVCSARTNSTGSYNDWLVVSYNGSTSSLSFRELESDGSNAASYSGASGLSLTATTSNHTANTFSNGELYVPNYRSSNNKSYSIDSVTENNATAAHATLNAGLWSNTAAITSISFAPNAGTAIVANSTFYLYGLAAVGTTPVIAPFATGGDVVTNDGTYWYHAFLSSGTFTPNKTLTASCLVVAGGGGGGDSSAGGGAAGGVIYFASQSLAPATAVTCTVGAGGTGSTGGGNNTSGGNSQFGSLTAAIGGGYGGSEGNYNGGNGGSGGGSAWNNGGSRIPGTSTQTGTGATAYYGNAGGYGLNAPYYSGGGGGGAGSVGADGSTASSGTGGAGGAGINTYSSWLSATSLGVSGYIAGGGAGGSNGSVQGAGGSGGGGTGGGGTSNYPSAGVVNTGSGGGGGAGPMAPQGVKSAGGSGIIIIRYPIA